MTQACRFEGRIQWTLFTHVIGAELDATSTIKCEAIESDMYAIRRRETDVAGMPTGRHGKGNSSCSDDFHLGMQRSRDQLLLAYVWLPEPTIALSSAAVLGLTRQDAA